MKVMDEEILVQIKIRQTTEDVPAFVCMSEYMCACMCTYVCVLHEARREMRRRKQCEGSGKGETEAVADSTANNEGRKTFSLGKCPRKEKDV